MLYLVGTPIGNLKELNNRAIEILNSVEYIACEDTRTSRVLLDAYDIKKPLKSYHKFNENKSGEEIIKDLKSGKDIAVISDAGMPGISDPGNILVNMAKAENIDYSVISGACACINAFILSGYDTPFTFIGFIPEKKQKEFMEKMAEIEAVSIFYCSPHSLIEDLQTIYKYFGDRDICVVRELTKKFEEITFSTLEKGYAGTVKGEFVVVVDKPQKTNNSENIQKDLEVLLNMGISKSDASKILAKAKNIKKNDIYKLTNND